MKIIRPEAPKNETREAPICKVCPKHCKVSDLKVTGENKVECKDFITRGDMMTEQNLESLGFWDCKCGHRNIIPRDTITVKCDACGKPRKFDIIDREIT
jgi:hypothetical protein